MRIFLVAIISGLFFASCQFNETMVLQEDGSGSLSLSMDMKEMLAFSQLSGDTIAERLDTVVYMRDFLNEKRDSIRRLPKAEQDQLYALQDYRFRTLMDAEQEQFYFDVITDFNSVDDLGDIMEAFERSSDFLQSTGDDEVSSDNNTGGAIGVRFSFENGRFVRDAYIKDEAKYKAQVDSLKSAESFMRGMRYTLKYTFPRKIKSTSAKDARFTLDGKTLELDRAFLEFMRDPDLLDLEVQLEN